MYIIAGIVLSVMYFKVITGLYIYILNTTNYITMHAMYM